MSANTPETLVKYLPPRVGYRRFSMTVRNGCGDEACPLVYVREDRSPRQYAVTAIAKAKSIIPGEGPWKLGVIVEHSPPLNP